MLVNLSLSPGYRLKITRASRLSELADRVITALAAIGVRAPPFWWSSAPVRQAKRQKQLQLDVRIPRRRATPSAMRALPTRARSPPGIAEERERRHKAELLALEAQMQAKLEALTRLNDDLTRHLEAKEKPTDRPPTLPG